MNNYYKKYIYEFIKKRMEKNKLKTPNGVSIITCTNKPHVLNNILENFNRQDYLKKELVLVINNDDIDLKKYQDKLEKYKNVTVFKISEKNSLGKCLNFAVDKCKYNVIAKFDDDDY